jgi:sugar-specific transcriptional regulator TrmB
MVGLKLSLLALLATLSAACGEVQRELKQTAKDIDEISDNREQIGKELGTEAQRAGEKAAAVIDKADRELSTPNDAGTQEAPAEAPASDAPPSDDPAH